ncbi:MAG: hypothetical protein ACI9J2_000399 [Saprospiraceae bacterium]|jgi:hypothetical protein
MVEMEGLAAAVKSVVAALIQVILPAVAVALVLRPAAPHQLECNPATEW